METQVILKKLTFFNLKAKTKLSKYATKTKMLLKTKKATFNQKNFGPLATTANRLSIKMYIME